MAHNDELSKFLRVRRAALTPEAAGLPAPGGRRVPGLRRDELALLAGVSVDYYTRLEQGRPITPSEEVLDALATALQLDPAERAYLHTVGRASPARRRATSRAQSVRPGLLALIEQLGDTPAFVLGRRTDVLAANVTARRLLADFAAMPARERNAARWLVLDEGARSLFGDDWERVASDITGVLRMDAARHPDDPRTADLVGELSIKSPHFRRWWAGRKVVEFGQGHKTLHHPLVGDLSLRTEAMTFPGDPDQMLIVFLAEPASPSRHALDLLTAWTATASPQAGSREAGRPHRK
ncbi:helix-turn-helix transcriptional regulator [Actinoplanes sp. Pm04-4]|uniref:Helix-turn-helix transcriptional regulator n=1 Tax=Paractinoplanes pyxinae TaxID=2997416 RepID=A0ABT4BCF6_9ACTN|nr:helix-turn-helix transcriptional regulator [Actinoplanes pyxinae]MCY1144200.1 helix-turn-helix transcriptional regulator [Actinoplanes pyxinae]